MMNKTPAYQLYIQMEKLTFLYIVSTIGWKLYQVLFLNLYARELQQHDILKRKQKCPILIYS